MRWKSWIVKWNFEIRFRNNENVANEINIEHVVDAIFANFDIILNTINEKRERFDVVDTIVAKMIDEINEFLVCFENVTNLNIKNFDIVVDEMIDKIVCKIVNKIVEILFFS